MKRLWVLTILSLWLVAVTLGSLLFTSSGAQNRLRPIPAHAQMVYNNKNPDWFLSFFSITGKKSDDLFPVWSLPSAGRILEKCPLAVATVPFGGRGRRDTWVAVSELGGPTALLFRWRLLLFPPEGVEPVRSYAAWPVWKLEHPSIPSRSRVRFSITDGLLICSISDDSHDINRLIDTFDGRADSLANRRNRRAD